jgi:Fe2+ or Zn2+ uptake regulation protein
MTRDEALKLVRAAGLRLTGPRRKILDAFTAALAPVTAEELHAQTGGDLSTVYRNLNAFVGVGLLDALPGANGEKRYELRGASKDGLRLMCLDCGKFMPLPEADLSHVGRAAAMQGFDVQSITLAAHCAHVCDLES